MPQVRVRSLGHERGLGAPLGRNGLKIAPVGVNMPKVGVGTVGTLWAKATSVEKCPRHVSEASATGRPLGRPLAPRG